MKKKDRDLFLKALDEIFVEKLDKADKEKCKISVENNTDGEKHIEAEGGTLALLVTLAGLEDQILKQTGCDRGTFDFIKGHITTMEAPNE